MITRNWPVSARVSKRIPSPKVLICHLALTEFTMDNVWMARATSSASMFRPFEDYLGLSQLVKNLNLSTADEDTTMLDYGSGTSSSRSRSSSASEEHNCNSWDDFRLNGVDVAEDNEGFQPFQPISTSRMKVSRLPLKNRLRRTPTWCVFCKNNQESEMVYGSHILKDSEGRTTCPILRNYTCPICGVSGDGAHTIKYCPLNKEETSLDTPSANLLKTPRTSTGKKRSEALLFQHVQASSGLTSRVNWTAAMYRSQCDSELLNWTTGRPSADISY